MKTKCLAFFLALGILFSSLSVVAFADGATVSISASSSVTVGNQVSVKISISGSERIGSWLFSLQYDPACLEYVSGADSGGGGTLSFSDAPADPVSKISKTVVFKTKKIGSTTVTIPGAQVVGFDSERPLGASSASRKINIVAAPTLSGDNNLSSLTLSAGELTPAFSASVTEYTASVPFEIAKVDVSAAVAHKKASVNVSGGELVVGDNTIQAVVTAENGKTRTYTITVNRAQSELAGSTALLEEREYQIAYDPATLTPPEGYTAATAPYGEKQILIYRSPLETLSVAYLTSEAHSDWFLFNEETQTFAPMVNLAGNASSFVVLDPPESVEIPFGFLPQSISVGERSISAYQSEDTALKNIYLVYAMAMDGNLGFYYYDATLSSFTSYFEITLPVVEESEEGKVDAEEVKLLQEKNDQLAIFVLSLGLASTVLFLALIITLAVKRKKKAEPDFEELVEIEIEKKPKKKRAKRDVEKDTYSEELGGELFTDEKDPE